jgi:hypothetical protein
LLPGAPRKPARAAIDLNDPVARAQSRDLRGRAGERRDHAQPAIAHVDLHAEAFVLAGRGLGQPFEEPLVEQR